MEVEDWSSFLDVVVQVEPLTFPELRQKAASEEDDKVVEYHVNPWCRVGNALISSRSWLCVLSDKSVHIFRSSSSTLSPLCQMDHWSSRLRCAALCTHPEDTSPCLVVVDEERIHLLEQRDPNALHTWHAIGRWPIHFAAADVALVRRQSNSFVVLLGSPCGLNVVSLSSGSKFSSSLLLSDFSVCHIQVAGPHVALATLDGHIGVWTLDEIIAATETTSSTLYKKCFFPNRNQQPFIWCSPSGQRITSVKFSPSLSTLAVVCWDGSGVLLKTSSSSQWEVVESFSSPSSFFPPSVRSSMGHPAYAAWSKHNDDEVLHIAINGGIKSRGKKLLQSIWRRKNYVETEENNGNDEMGTAAGWVALDGDETTCVMLQLRGTLQMLKFKLTKQ